VALEIVLHLTRSGVWSVGCGTGGVGLPLPRNVRAATGPAFVAARDAVGRAKRKSTRFALGAPPGSDTDAADAEALIDLLLVLRSRRSEEGWELADLLHEGLTQAAAAERLGITPQAVSKRARAAELRAEQAAIAPLIRMMESLDRLGGREEEGTP